MFSAEISVFEDSVAEVQGIGPKRSERIIASWADQKIIREIMAFLQSHGVSTSRAVRIYKTYGADAIPHVTENPTALHATSWGSVSSLPI